MRCCRLALPSRISAAIPPIFTGLKNVMVLDPSPSIRRLVQMYLSGEQIVYGQDMPLLSINLLQSVAINVVLMELKLPGMSGMAFIKFLRSNPITRAMPIVVMSSASDNTPANRKLAQLAGANAWLVKPFNAVQLRTVLAPFLK